MINGYGRIKAHFVRVGKRIYLEIYRPYLLTGGRWVLWYARVL